MSGVADPAAVSPARVRRRDQLLFDGVQRLERLRRWGPPGIRTVAAAGLRALGPGRRRLAARGALVRATVWGRPLLMRADHQLPATLAGCPTFAEPLALAVQALGRRPVRLVDVGANVGDTVALLEAAAPGACRVLCVEPHPEFAALCRVNTAASPHVRVEECFIADRAGLPVRLHAHEPGKAASRLVAGEGDGGAAAALTRTLDEVAAPFVDAHGGLDVLKVDTDGFDFKVLRSARALLADHRPLLFFELHPALWREAGEEPEEVFPYLQEAGYRHFAFFTNRGGVHAQVDEPSPLLFRTLVALSLARRRLDDLHFDVLTGDGDVCRRVVTASLERVRAAGRIGPTARP